MTPMECPTCKEPLLTLEYEEIEVDYCAECQGVWLDEGELDLLFGDHGMTQGFMTAGDPSAAKDEAVRLCPICDAPMRKAVTGGAEPVVHDYCPKEHGVWFDGGELLTVLTRGAVHGGNAPVVRWLREMFPGTTKTEQG